MACGQLNIRVQRMKREPYLKSYTKNNSKWIKEQNLRSKTLKKKDLKLFKETGENIHDLGFNKGLLDMTPKA